MSKQPVFGEHYRLLWLAKEERRIGEVRNYATVGKGYRVVPILLDDELMKRASMRFLVSSWNSRGPEITVSEVFMTLRQDFKEAGIWHEMGHIHHEHFLNNEFSNQNQLRAARIAAIESGQVTSYEAEADDPFRSTWRR